MSAVFCEHDLKEILQGSDKWWMVLPQMIQAMLLDMQVLKQLAMVPHSSESWPFVDA